jgi:GNAT superfamily N-acetyltransferase
MIAELIPRFVRNLTYGVSGLAPFNWYDLPPRDDVNRRGSLMTAAARIAIADTFVDAIIRLELDHSRDMVGRYGSTRYFVYPNGRAGCSMFTHEFFPYDVPADEAIQFAQSLAPHSPHLLSPIGERIRDETGIYEAAGYERVGNWTLMVRPLTHEVSRSGDERALVIEDADTEDRVVSAILAIGESEHPTRSGHVADPTIRQRWISDSGEPASFGRMVLLGNHAYLGDMATVPAYRRRGHASAIMRSLLDDALAVGATACVLASTSMAHDLYLRFGFQEVMPMVGFQTRNG